MKLTKVFFGDKRLKDIYVGASKFEVFKFKAMRLFKRVMITLFVVAFGAGAVYGGYQFGEKSNIHLVMAQKEVDVTDVRFNRKIEDMKMKLVDDLMNCESPGYKDEDGLITYDPQKGNTVASKIPSIGRLQFKVSTVVHYQKTLYNRSITPTDAIKLALDTEQSRVLAKDIMFKSNNLANDWLNCANKLNLNEKIKLIKVLEK